MDTRTNGLPHRDNDSLLTLYSHYFLASELMHTNHEKLMLKWQRNGRITKNDRWQMPIYFCTWLGFLAVTAEGFKRLRVRKLLQDERPPDFAELVPKVDVLGQTLKAHDDALRRFRNIVFHLREGSQEVERFFYERPNRLEWAEQLQSSFADFFSSYRILCQVQYALENRRSEYFG